MDSSTFKEKYIPYHQKMFRVAYRLVEDVCDAEDLVQETYIKMWNKRDDLLLVDNAESYCITMLRNLCLDFIRSRARHPSQSSEDLQIADKVEIVSEIEQKEDMLYVESLLKQLPEQQQQVIKLRHFDDCSSEEIEQIMGLTSVNVRVLLSRARKRIKELYNVSR
ncbi:RNA polymerase sigma factor [Dysgonomonas capnocytophagoides]|uniref:RNA polymerase sigma factor n=1 Tax=Dysgonomonas capnocytophagoides TaxID=45254 RepID=UPI0029224819|nr:RNA polymerase sigma factor [Dysgonomonas capnocytophagoides]